MNRGLATLLARHNTHARPTAAGAGWGGGGLDTLCFYLPREEVDGDVWFFLVVVLNSCVGGCVCVDLVGVVFVGSMDSDDMAQLLRIHNVRSWVDQPSWQKSPHEKTTPTKDPKHRHTNRSQRGRATYTLKNMPAAFVMHCKGWCVWIRFRSCPSPKFWLPRIQNGPPPPPPPSSSSSSSSTPTHTTLHRIPPQQQHMHRPV